MQQINKIEEIDGIKLYAPEFAFDNNDYPEEAFEFLYKIEDKNFWFRSRNVILKHLIKKYLKPNQTDTKKFMEIGCGTGYVLKGIESLGKIELTGAEIYLQGLKFAKKRLPDATFVQLDATNMPFTNEYNAIGAFDVIEHIEDDIAVIENVKKALLPNGYFFISVPQYMWMWSKTDDIAYHKRRYTRKELKTKLVNAGFKVEYIGSFVFALFPFMMISRLLSKGKKAETKSTDHTGELQMNPLLNKLFTILMKIDEVLIKIGFQLPFGGSIICVAKL